MTKKAKKQTISDTIFEAMVVDDTTATSKKEPLIEPIADLEKPEPKKEQKIRVLPTVNLKVFSQISGVKWDQLAAFRHYAKSERIQRLTIPEWQGLYDTYKTRPVK